MQEKKAKSVSQAKMGQVAMICKDLDKTIEYYSSLLSIGPFEVQEIKEQKMRAAFAMLGPVQLELIQPVGEGNPMSKFLDGKEVCLHHFGFFVTDRDKELARFQELGVRIMQKAEVPGMKFAFLDTKEMAGVNFELLQPTTQKKG